MTRQGPRLTAPQLADLSKAIKNTPGGYYFDWGCAQGGRDISKLFRDNFFSIWSFEKGKSGLIQGNLALSTVKFLFKVF